MGAGKSYHELSPTILISLLGFALFPDEPLGVWDFVLKNPATEKVLTWDEVLVYVELKKLRSGIERLREQMRSNPGHRLTEAERLAIWSGYMSNDGSGVNLMRTALSGDKVFDEVTAAEREYWGTPEYRYYQLRAQLEELDRRAIEEGRVRKAEQQGLERGLARGMAQGMAEGRAQGMAEGVAQGRKETARNLLRMGLSPEKAAEATGLSVQEVRSLI